MKKSTWDEREETLDTLFAGRLKIFQKKSGYRFAIDALLLAHFSKPRPADRIIELGTGCGVIPLILTLQQKGAKVIGVEIQPSLADLARKNADLNHLSSRLEIWEKDLKDLIGGNQGGQFDLVISNPPYRKVGSGRINPLLEKAVARHEIKATLKDVLEAAHYLLKIKGRLTVIYPAGRAVDLIQEMRQLHLEPKKLQFVHSHLNDEACLVLAEAVKGGMVQAKVLPPFILYRSKGRYTPQAQALFRGEG